MQGISTQLDLTRYTQPVKKGQASLFGDDLIPKKVNVWGELLKEARDIINKQRAKQGWKYRDKSGKLKRSYPVTIPQLAGKVGFMSKNVFELEAHIEKCKKTNDFAHNFFRLIKVKEDFNKQT